MENLQTELSHPASKLFKYTLFSILDTAKQSTSAQNHNPEYLEKVTIKLLQPAPGQIGWDIFSLNYIMEIPLTTIFDAEINFKYLKIFNFLWKIKSLEFWLNEIWIMHKKFSQDNISEQYRGIITKCNIIRHQMLFFIQNLFSYLMLEVIETELNIFIKNIKEVDSMDDIIQKHHEFVDNITRKSMNSN